MGVMVGESEMLANGSGAACVEQLWGAVWHGKKKARLWPLITYNTDHSMNGGQSGINRSEKWGG